MCICHFVRNLGVRNFRTYNNQEKKNVLGRTKTRLNSGMVLILVSVNSGFLLYIYRRSKGMGIPGRFAAICTRETTFVTSCLFSCKPITLMQRTLF